MSQPNDKPKSKTKKDLVKTIAERIDLPQLRTRQLVQQTFDALIDALVEEGRVELRNFGIFQIKRREARMARNPRTGQAVPVLAKTIVTFKPGKEMEARVRSLEQRPRRPQPPTPRGPEDAASQLPPPR
ncbi:MAG: integration host factor subunit beta [Planctomycetaceae bacterium]|nr:integration host factor subunit beta [Planctomycetaceae bacterium]